MFSCDDELVSVWYQNYLGLEEKSWDFSPLLKKFSGKFV